MVEKLIFLITSLYGTSLHFYQVKWDIPNASSQKRTETSSFSSLLPGRFLSVLYLLGSHGGILDEEGAVVVFSLYQIAISIIHLYTCALISSCKVLLMHPSPFKQRNLIST